MITRKRYRDNCEVNKLLSSSLCLRTIVKKTSSSKGSSNNPAPKRPKMSMDFSRFLLLLEEVCNGHHKEKISCVDVMTDCFWLEFAAVWNSRTPKNLNLDGETCEKVAKRLKALHTKMENPDVYPGSKSVKGAATLKPKLDNVFNHHDELFAVWGLEQVPETPPYQIYKGTTSARVSVSMQKTSTTSSIDQESITAIEDQHNYNGKDVRTTKVCFYCRMQGNIERHCRISNEAIDGGDKKMFMERRTAVRQFCRAPMEVTGAIHGEKNSS